MRDADGAPLRPVYLMNQFDTSLPLHLDVREVLRQQLGERLLPLAIRHAGGVSEALAEGMTIVDYDPDSPAAQDFVGLAKLDSCRLRARGGGLPQSAMERTMSLSSLGKDFESGTGLIFRLLRIIVVLSAFTILWVHCNSRTDMAAAGSARVVERVAGDLDGPELDVITWLTLTLMFVSCYSTFRYGFWRISTTIQFFLDPGAKYSLLDTFFIWLLVFAESYAFIILYLGYMQTLWPAAADSCAAAGRSGGLA